jgi:SAM-dependent methyltransferase
MSRTDEQTRRLFDEWAATYDADLKDSGGPGPLTGYARSIESLASTLPVESGWQVLDIGIGSGAVAEHFEARGASITGIDISEKMLEACQEKHPDYTLHTGTFNEIPTDDNTFDAVVSGFAFHETDIQKRLEACTEMARVLKPEGYLCLLDVMFASEAAMQHAKAMIGNMWDDSEDYALVSNLDTTLREAGFTSVSWQQTAPFHWLVTARLAE